jgi:hypothetical protein
MLVDIIFSILYIHIILMLSLLITRPSFKILLNLKINIIVLTTSITLYLFPCILLYLKDNNYTIYQRNKKIFENLLNNIKYTLIF